MHNQNRMLKTYDQRDEWITNRLSGARTATQTRAKFHLISQCELPQSTPRC